MIYRVAMAFLTLCCLTVNEALAIAATGGTVTNYTEGGTNFTAHIFTSTGSTSIVFSDAGSVQYLIVAGGGSGGGCWGFNAYSPGGGGAGGVLIGSTNVIASTYSIYVGAGGAQVSG